MAKTEVILIQNIVGLGGESDLVKVAAGYARNYLFPQGLAVPLTAANKRRIEALKQRRAEREAHEFNTMSELSKSFQCSSPSCRSRPATTARCSASSPPA
jgi:large subunit ribosomal protein L9